MADRVETTFTIDASSARNIASKASRILTTLPSESRRRRMADKSAGKAVLELRRLAVHCAAASSWSASDARRAVKLIDALEDRIATSGGGFAESARQCGERKNECRQECDMRDGSFFCYLDCRIEYAVCLTAVVIHGNEPDQ